MSALNIGFWLKQERNCPCEIARRYLKIEGSYFYHMKASFTWSCFFQLLINSGVEFLKTNTYVKLKVYIDIILTYTAFFSLKPDCELGMLSFFGTRKFHIYSWQIICVLQPFCSLIQIHGHNRARQRDKLGHILEEFATLQDEVRARFPSLLKLNDAHTLSRFLKTIIQNNILTNFSTWSTFHLKYNSFLHQRLQNETTIIQTDRYLKYFFDNRNKLWNMYKMIVLQQAYIIKNVNTLILKLICVQQQYW